MATTRVTVWTPEIVLNAVQKLAMRNMGRAVVFAAGQVRRSMKRGGRISRAVGKVKRVRVAHSAPGEVPFVQSGKLRQSIMSDVRVTSARSHGTQQEVVGRYGSAGLRYARRLEMGFFGADSAGHKIRQAARPYLKPILVRFRTQIKQLLLAPGRGR